MGTVHKLQLGRLEDKLNALLFPIAISDLALPDHPLVFVNEAFHEVTGFGEDMLGENCRFLQHGLENVEARAEINAAFDHGQRTQVVLHNRRRNGETFYNMLLLETMPPSRDGQRLAMGSQFDLGPENPMALDALPDTATRSAIESRVVDPTMALRLERRRIVADSVVRMLRSWIVIRDTPGRRAT